MSRKCAILMRVLSALTLLEAADGLFMAGSALLATGGSLRNSLLGKYPHSEWALYGMPVANLVFIALLLVSGARIWRLDRKGLWLLACTLCAEVAYFVGVALIPVLPYFQSDPRRKAAADAFSTLTGFGNLGLSVQILTAYPLIAGLLIFLSYRYLGVPARDVQRGMQTP